MNAKQMACCQQTLSVMHGGRQYLFIIRLRTMRIGILLIFLVASAFSQGTYVSGYEQSQYGIEWMRFEEGCTLPEIVQKIPHVAFKVKDIEKEIVGKEVIIKPNSPSKGVKVAFIIENCAPIEFIQIDEE